MKNPLQQLMPEILQHKGVWRGTYRHIDIEGNIIDEHNSQVECIFPESGPVVYTQRNKFSWPCGRIYEVEFDGVIREQKIFWDTPTFSGFGWQASPHIFLLELERKDEPGAWFYESIVMGDSGTNRARTWHWFKNGKCFKRTLCDENLVVT
ncbi:hypothetical protein [Rheinheimera salexigens]|uniref:DUF3598 domain-containing protein n=1 Tax=Rheinheimera salexigens TaxID=1628148 RepID=A0A1E7Q6L1_9GAMM|nr:hypothetical protein [Rheinheimera salexigens]OEY69713.1 hypothetical protein BI198_09180 [Rheinheimera salexigens]